MPPARSARLLVALPLLAGVGAVWADVGATVSVQTDARERGISYSDNKPGAQLGLAWDGANGWYAGASLAHARFVDQSGAAMRVYGGRVFALQPGLDAEAGVLLNRFENVSHYDFAEVYAGLLGEGWNLRLYASNDYYGIGQRSLYGEANLRWPLADGVAAVGHIGVLRGQREQSQGYGNPRGPTRVDARAGASFQLGSSGEMQLVWVSASSGGPYTWINPTRRRTVVLNLTIAF